MKWLLKIQYFGGRGASSGGGTANAGSSQNSPSGITYEQFNAMTMDEKYQAIDQILSDTSLVVPSYLDDSITTKLIYGLGMNGKPTVVDDATLDSMSGQDIYRTVYEQFEMPPPSSADVLDQIRNGDYTQMSGSGGSAHNRAIYFASDFSGSASYGEYERNSMIMRAKVNSSANIVDERSLYKQMTKDTEWIRSPAIKHTLGWQNDPDAMSIYAIAHGIDGWTSRNYTMIVNRSVLTASSKNKRISTDSLQINTATARSWAEAADAN